MGLEHDFKNPHSTLNVKLPKRYEYIKLQITTDFILPHVGSQLFYTFLSVCNIWVW